MNPYWWVLLAAVVVEIAWAMSLKWIQMQPGVASISTSLVLTARGFDECDRPAERCPLASAHASGKLFGWRESPHSAASICSITSTAASAITVPGPKTAAAPASRSQS